MPDRALPPIADGRLARWLMEIGPVSGGSFGAAPVAWAEIESWAALAAISLTPWEALTLRQMSAAYAGELAGFHGDKVPPPPWLPEGSDYHRRMEAQLIAGLSSMSTKKGGIRRRV